MKNSLGCVEHEKREIDLTEKLQHMYLSCGNSFLSAPYHPDL